jgi:signal transduction histidine kinase/CheY-like chemotaxis protein/HAMP domain-containing protein
MRKDSLFFQFLLVTAVIGILLAAATGYIISDRLVATFTEMEERPLHLISDEIFGMVSDSFHGLLDDRNEDDPVELETAKQDVLARILHYKPPVSSAGYSFVVLDGNGRALLDSGDLFDESKTPEFPEGSAEGKVRMVDKNRRALVGYVKYFPAWRWRLVSLILEEELQKETVQIKVWIYGAGIAGFLLLMALFYALLKKRVQEPLSALVRYAKDLEEAHYTPPPEGGRGEVKELSEAFHRMAAAIREREQKLVELAKFPESNPNLLMKVSPEGEVLYANPSVATKLAEMGLATDLPALLLPSGIREIVRGLRLEKERKKELAWNAGDRTIEYTVFGFADEDAVVFHGVDITERKRMEEQLSHAHKMETLGRIAGGVAHDFNNLLAGILGYATLLKSQPLPDVGVSKAVESIEKAAERGTQLTRQLLGFARKGSHEFLPLDLNRIVDETVDIVAQTFIRSITIRRDKTADLPSVKGDGTQMHQCLMNLCINARDAMTEGGTLTIATRRVLLEEARPEKLFRIPAGLYASVEVADEGHGMDEETLERIFDPFFTTKSPGEGTGLGMSMVYGIVKNHGGYILVNSSPERGTTVEILFPGGETLHAAPDIPQRASAAGPRPGPSGTVLLVDDEAFVRDVGVAMLNALGYDVLTACNGKEGVEIFRRDREKISIVILDLMMPVMDGRKAFEGIREIDPDARIVISTGFSGDQDVDRLKEMGASAILPKPYSYNTMTSVVTLLESR